MSASRMLRLVAPVRAVVSRPAVSYMATRTFAARSAPVMKDVIKELYIKELQNYTPAPETKGVDASQVKDFKIPAAPQAPVVDAAADLSAWETANVEVVEALQEVEEEEEIEEEEEAEESHH